MSDIATTKAIQGRESTGNAFEEAARLQRSLKSRVYSCKQFTVANNTVAQDYSAISGCTDAFTRLGVEAIANKIEIKSDQAITIYVATKAQATIVVTGLDAIQITANSLRSIDWIADITGIFITNASGNTANIEIAMI